MVDIIHSSYIALYCTYMLLRGPKIIWPVRCH